MLKNNSTTKNDKVKAVGLLSGGLDSTLATKMLLEQGIEVYAINFTSPFCTCTPKSAGCAAVITAVKELGGIPLRRVALKENYLEIIANPKHGHGTGMNPCIDCRIMKIKKAGEYMNEIGASFLFTGEVIGQRPMSQQKRTLELIDRESGLKGYILRPLSAEHLEPTKAETDGLVDRDRLLGFTGRSRKPQMALADELGIIDYPCPAGGCLLTDKNFAERMRDYLAHSKTLSMKDVERLKIGRHFRLDNGDKIIVARDEQECNALEKQCYTKEHLFIPYDFLGPAVLLEGNSLKDAVEKMVRYTKQPVTGESLITHIFSGVTMTLKINDILQEQVRTL